MFNPVPIQDNLPLLLQICGVIGSIVYVGGFALVQCDIACGNGTAYSVSKIIAAALVLLSLIDSFNLAAFLIQIGFIGFGLWGLARRTGTSADREQTPTRSTPLRYERPPALARKGAPRAIREQAS
ncbi:CBU_0592 family membrane protein [Aliiruegeria sabulilitoris]|uniref:CBU_0592 family membrane protein n=1 Tax=Aliiruegeria sabulilitoris TaxID=1510458 RepID=UPI0008345953|nr:hypothetical protein [Aliiruegeria sabulilitoris]NDR57321.1 hypothetical protein [Pseudoruegeria sp. M32A2M]